MIEMHTHILPGIDDGAKDEQEAILMAHAAVEEGISVIIATPHHANGRFINPGNEIKNRVHAFNMMLKQNRISLKVLPGQEVRIHQGLLEDLEQGNTILLSESNYLLLELPSSRIPSYTEEMIHELRVLGITPIIAHPERNAELAASPSILMRLLDRGALTQLTSHSVDGLFGRKLQKLSLEWCRQGMVHLISSDAHNVDGRPFGLSKAYSVISSQVNDTVMAELKDNSERLINQLEIRTLSPVLLSKKWWKIW
ncbi:MULTISPECIES: CpsB/CapC family capsule biosynthesis tyrosine phosphatase [unclassified Paenibacillus]|uniref:tyrosine-protein phosphatase n=1 Tax=unclassified Paenibacillus TaxID=185978 RepID=UPI001AE650F4|nr:MULTISPECIES: CpsB/CapC family capsule biosynthesis tyrosine phosphatase [unclassified Paenibacillus]MBP1154431.1 protein-tyrosine phosphatase [Paenibacillus sp. PvP091]MBP1170185.1 protein-tyrosine phosphatase [Paenibacillus sp. PvR098]MBP2441213.1 protein-tyrosine phosphatase [Paenibacillus sp. PvP052]